MGDEVGLNVLFFEGDVFFEIEHGDGEAALRQKGPGDEAGEIGTDDDDVAVLFGHEVNAAVTGHAPYRTRRAQLRQRALQSIGSIWYLYTRPILNH